MGKRSWGSLGWCSADGGSGCKAVAGVKWEVVGGWVLWKEEMEAAGMPGLAVDFFFFVSLGKWVRWVGADEWKPRCRDPGISWFGSRELSRSRHIASRSKF